MTSIGTTLGQCTRLSLVFGSLVACSSDVVGGAEQVGGASPVKGTTATAGVGQATSTAPVQSAAVTPASPNPGAGAAARAPAMSAASAGAAGMVTVPNAGTAGGSAAAGAGSGEASGAGGNAAVGGSGGSDSAMARPSSRGPLTGLMFPTSQEKITEKPVFHITRPKDLKAPGGLLPVIAWANGGCFRSDFTWQPLFDRWAGAGFVVLSLTGSGADDDLSSMLNSTTKTEHGGLVDWVVKANATGPYAGQLDLSRIALAGNSCGGVTSLQLAAEDKRAAAVFVLSGSSALGAVDKQIMQAISVPVGYITGNPSEDVAGPNAVDDYAALRDGVPAMLVQRKAGDHITVSTDEKVLPQDAEIALNWLDLALYGTKQAFDALSSRNVCEHCTPGDWRLQGKHLESLVR